MTWQSKAIIRSKVDGGSGLGVRHPVQGELWEDYKGQDRERRRRWDDPAADGDKYRCLGACGIGLNPPLTHLFYHHICNQHLTYSMILPLLPDQRHRPFMEDMMRPAADGQEPHTPGRRRCGSGSSWKTLRA